MAGNQQSLINAAFSAVSHNEVSGVASVANRLSSPLPGTAAGNRGWTIAWGMPTAPASSTSPMTPIGGTQPAANHDAWHAAVRISDGHAYGGIGAVARTMAR